MANMQNKMKGPVIKNCKLNNLIIKNAHHEYYIFDIE